MNELHLFAGAGGGILGGILCGHTTVCAVEIEPYPREVLLQRQRDGILPKFPIWDDVTTFDGRPWRGLVDIVCGGFPCQDISAAGHGAGITGERSGLWKEYARIINEVLPRFAFVENSPILTSRGLGVVLGDLAEMGYNARWGCFDGFDVQGVLQRERIFILASRIGDGIVREAIHVHQSPSNACNFWMQHLSPELQATLSNWEVAHGEFCGVDDGLSVEMGQLKAYGNAQIPAVAALAWEVLS